METSNLNFVTAMVSWGAKVKGTERNGKRVIFHLEDPPSFVPTMVRDATDLGCVVTGTFEQLFILFSSRRLLYHPSFPDTARNLKGMIYG